jgi:hypothetical protein
VDPVELHPPLNEDGKGSFAQKKMKSGRDPQEAWGQDDLITGKPPVVK